MRRRAAQGVYDVSVRASYAALAKLKPARFSKTEQGEELIIDVADGVASAPVAKGAPPAVPVAVAVRFQEAVAVAGQGDTPRALAEFTKLMASSPTLAGPALNLGILFARGERWPEAEAALKEALLRNPGSAAAAAQIGIVERQLGQFPGAEQAYRRRASPSSKPMNAASSPRAMHELLSLSGSTWWPWFSFSSTWKPFFSIPGLIFIVIS